MKPLFRSCYIDTPLTPQRKSKPASAGPHSSRKALNEGPIATVLASYLPPSNLRDLALCHPKIGDGKIVVADLENKLASHHALSLDDQTLLIGLLTDNISFDSFNRSKTRLLTKWSKARYYLSKRACHRKNTAGVQQFISHHLKQQKNALFNLLEWGPVTKKALYQIDLILQKNPLLILATNSHFYTPLHFAARNGSLAAVKSLIAKGAKASINNRFGNSPLRLAKRQDHLDIVRYLKYLP